MIFSQPVKCEWCEFMTNDGQELFDHKQRHMVGQRNTNAPPPETWKPAVLNSGIDILEYLKTHCNGEKNAKPRDEIAKALGTNIRELKYITADLVARGYGICPSNSGLYYSDDPDAIERESNRLYSTAAETKKHADNLMAIANRIRATKQQGNLI